MSAENVDQHALLTKLLEKVDSLHERLTLFEKNQAAQIALNDHLQSEINGLKSIITGLQQLVHSPSPATAPATTSASTTSQAPVSPYWLHHFHSSAAKWKQFWSLQIPLNARNTWFRILHDKLTTRKLMHRRLGDSHRPGCPTCRALNPSCPVAPIEDTTHFLFSCPPKLAVWRQTLSLYISPRFSRITYEEYRDILHFRLDVDRSSNVLFPTLSVFQVVACIQQAIWSAHYRQVFQHTPFNSSNVINTAHRNLLHLDSQLSFDTVI